MNKLISLCMIVKNEEKFLERCLKSVAQWVDEIIIVDTGSTDRTKEIALSFTDKVYDFKWVNDFAAARNEALKHATEDWILILDADEYMEEQEIHGLRSFLIEQQPTPGVVYGVTVRNFMNSANQAGMSETPILRVFPNRMGFEYHRPIHEQIRNTKGLTFEVHTLPFRILHSGYLNEIVEAKNKQERNMAIFNQMISQNELSDYDHSMLGQQLAMAGQHEQALHHLEIAFSSGKTNFPWFLNNIWAMIDIYLQTHQYIKAWDLINDHHMTDYTDYPDIRCARGMILLSLGLREQAKQELLTAHSEAELRATSQKDLSLFSPNLATRMPLSLLADIFGSENNFSQALYYLTLLLRADDQAIEVWLKTLELLSLNETPENIVSFLDRLLSTSSFPEKNTMLAKISVSIGNRQLAQHYVDRLTSITQLNLSEQLRFALLSSDLTAFEHFIQTSTLEKLVEPAAVKMIILGSLVWSRLEWVELCEHALPDESIGLQFAKTVIVTSNDVDMSSELEVIAADVLSQLYILRAWDTFDSLIERCSSATVINKLSNIFLSNHFVDTAMQYYQYLLDRNELNVASCENLAFFHLINGKTEEALEFWAHAIRLHSTPPIRLFIQYCMNCTDSHAKETMKLQLLSQYPDCANSPLIKNL